MSYDKAPEFNDPELAPEPGPQRRRLSLLIGLIAMGLLFAGAGWYWLTKGRASAPKAASAGASASQTKELAARLEQLTAQLAAHASQPTNEERLQLLEDAIAVEQALARARPTQLEGDGQRLRDWRSEVDTGRGRQQSLIIEQLEKQSRAPGLPIEESVARAKEALRLQRQINASGAADDVKDYTREERLGQMLLELEAVPLHALMAAALGRAQAATKAERWTDALAAYRETRDLQLRLNQEYSHTPYSDLAAIERIDTEVASLGAAGLHVQVENNLQQARAAATAGRDEAAANLFQKATTLQKKLNEQFPRSRFVTMGLLRQIEAEGQTIRAAAVGRELRALDDSAAAHLRKRETFQVGKDVQTGLEKLAALAASLPHAQGLDEELRLRLNYLALRQADLAKIQDQVYDLLLPLPGGAKTSLLKTEVPQALYASVMNSNPSRNPGPALPVDSVNYAEAQEFCRRLGWILGARVRLPSEAEFRQAIGNLNDSRLFAAWSAESSGGRTQATGLRTANEAGFLDLLGNVAEWLADDGPDSATAPRAGGNYTTSAAALAAIPVERAPRAERSRATGFRFIVELELAAP